MLRNGTIWIAVIYLFCLASANAAHAASVTSVDIARPEGQRHYLMATPDHLASGKHPLVILLHGHRGSAAQVLGQNGSAGPLSVWLQIADREQVLVAAPDGAKGNDGTTGWNDCRADATSSPKTDDTGFISAIIDKEIAAHDADPARVYVMGMSNGGIMTFRLATEIAPKLAGFAAVSASMASNSVCSAPKMPLSALIISGTADPLVPYQGGAIHFHGFPTPNRGSVIGIEDSALFWRKLDQISTEASTTEIVHRDPDDQTRATRMTWGSARDKVQVELIRIDKGGHLEPSITRPLGRVYTLLFGAQNGDLEAAEEAWTFFKDKRAATSP